MSSLIDKSNKDSLKQPLVAKVSEQILKEIEHVKTTSQPRKLYPRVHKNPLHSIFNEVGQFYDPKTIDFDWDQIYELWDDYQNINSLNKDQMILINEMIEAQLNESVNLKVQYAEDKFMPNQFANGKNTQEVSQDKGQEIIENNHRDQKFLLQAVLENSDFLKTLKSQLRKLDEIKTEGRRPNEYGILTAEEQADKTYYLDKFVEKVIYLEGKIYIVLQYTLKSKNLNRIDYKFKVFEYDYESKLVELIFKGSIHDGIPYEFDIKPHQDVIIQDGENLQYCVFEEKINKNLDHNVAEIPPKQSLKQFNLKTKEETTLQEFKQLFAKENYLFFAIWFVQTNTFMTIQDKKCQYLVRDSKITNTKRFLMLNMIKLAEFDYIYEIRDLDDIEKTQKAVDADENKHELSDFFGMQYNVADVIYLNIFSVMGENDHFKWNGTQLLQVLVDDIDKETNEKFTTLQKVIQETSSLKKICRNEQGETFTQYNSDRLMLNKFQLLMECLVGVTSNLNFEVVFDDINRKVLILIRSDQDYEIKMLPFSNQTYILQVDMFSAFQQILSEMPKPIINLQNYIFSKKIRNVAVNSNYQQIIIDDTQYNYDGHDCIPTHFKTKFIQQQKIVKGKKEITDLEDDEVAFLSNEGCFLMQNNEGELDYYSITLNTNNYINNCVVPQIEEKELDEKVETQQEMEERQFIEQEIAEKEAIQRAILVKQEAQKKQEVDLNIEVKCVKDHYLVKHVGAVPEYAGLGSPRCDVCKQDNLDNHKVFYRCIPCQFDCCIACTYMRCEPPILKQMMYTGAHNCIMTRKPANTNTGWACDGRNLGKGCLGGITDFYQTEHIQGFSCQKCDFDLCMTCMFKYKKPIKDSSSAYKSLSLKCKEEHSMKSTSGIPKDYVGRLKSVSCENCYQNNIDKHELYYRCKECEYDLCLSCSLNRSTPTILNEKMNIILFHYDMLVMPPNFIKRWTCKGTESKKGCDQYLENYDQTEFVQGYWNEDNDYALCLKCVIKFKKPILSVYEQLEIYCEEEHLLEKHKGRVKEYGGGAPQCDICTQEDLHMHDMFYRCPTCQYDCCLSCSLGNSTPPYFQDLMFSKVHECAMQKRYANQNTGWACDARKIGAGCQSGITDFRQTQYVQGYNCSKCDFDMCIKCVLKYKKEIRIETDLEEMTIQCEKKHQMEKQIGNPYNNNATVFCDGCKRKNIELCPYFYRCGECSMDICLQCSFDRCEENQSIIEKAKLMNTNKQNESKVKSIKMLETNIQSRQLKKDAGKTGKQSKQQQEMEAKLPFVFLTLLNLEKDNLQRCFMTSLSQQFKENEMNEVPMMIQNVNNHGVYILLIDLRNRKLLQTLQLDIEWDEYSAITRSNLIYSSELYILQSTSAKTVYSQNYHIVLHQTSVNRLVMFEFRIDWSFVGQAPMKTKITLISKSVFITRDINFSHETFCSSLTDENMVIQGVKINFEFEGNLVSLDFYNNQQKDEKVKTIDNEFTMTKYKKFYNAKNDMVAVCVQVKLKDSIIASNYFTEFGKNRFIRQSIKTCLNMLQFDIFDFIQRTVLIRDKFQGVEGFQGMNSLDVYYQKPQQIKKMIARLQHEHCKGNIGSLLQVLFEDDKDNERIDQFRRSGLMRKKGDISYDFCFFEILERCLMDKNIQLVTADIVIKFLFKQEYNPNTQRLFVMLMPVFLQCPLKSRHFFDFLGVDNDVDEEDQEQEKTQSLLLEIECEHSERLPQFSNDNLMLQAKNFYGLNPVMSVNNLVEDLIINGKNVVSSDFEIRHYYIETRNLIWHEKLRNIQYKRGEVKIIMNDFYIADLMCKVIAKTGNNIEDQPSIRNIIDQQFEISNSYFLSLMIFYISTVMAPFFIQLMTADWMTVVVCNCIQMASACYFLYLEFQQMKDQGSEYLNEIWNLFDFVGFFFITIHFLLRLSTLRDNITIIHNQDSDHSMSVDQSEYTHILFSLKILSVLILVQTFMKVMFFLRVNADFGLLVQLVGQCISDVQQFGAFLVVWIVFFTVQSLIMGMRVETGDYDGLGFKMRAFLQMYRNSIGDIAPPKYDLYLDSELNITSTENTLMITIIWIVWFLNQVFILIILLNFLIAIISQSYEQVMSQSVINKYIHRADLNRECRLLMSHSLQPIEILIYSAQKDYDTGESWTGFVTSLKNFVRNQNNVVKEKLTILRHMLQSQIFQQSKNQNKVNKEMLEKIDAIASAQKTEDPTQKILNAIQELTETLKRKDLKGEGGDDN